jgi:acetate kinase
VKPVDARTVTINGGSSSIKFAVFDAGEPPRRSTETKKGRQGT